MEPIRTYLGTKDLEEIYEKIKGSQKGMRGFVSKAQQKIGTRTESGAYIFKDEQALFEIFQQYFAEELRLKGIDCFGRLMQYMS